MIHNIRLIVIVLVSTVISVSAKPTLSQSSGAPTSALQQFAGKWDDSTWLPKEPGRISKYMRPLNDEGWKLRMLALHAIVKQGDEAIEDVRGRLRDGTTPERALAAQALGYMRAEAGRDDLLRALEQDSEPVVRLYAADSLGMLGDALPKTTWQKLSGKEANRDVKRHIDYVLERAGQPTAESVVKRFVDWDAQTMDTARVGEAAPDFELQSLAGDTIRLRNFQGKKSVVLVFVYGDTCPVCHGQLAKFRDRIADMEKLGAQLIAVDPHETYSAKYFLKEVGSDASDLHYPLLLDPAHTVSATYGVAFQNRVHTELSDRPATFIIDRGGVIRYARRASTFADRPTPDDILSELRKLPAE